MALESSRLIIRATRPDPRSTMVSVHGEIDIATAPMFSTTLLAVVVIPGGGHTEVDLDAVAFFGACGVDALAAARDHAATAGTTLGTTAAPHTPAGRVLDLLGWVHDPGLEPDRPTPLSPTAARSEPATGPDHVRPHRGPAHVGSVSM